MNHPLIMPRRAPEAPTQAPAALAPVSFWGRVKSLFLPRHRVPPPPSAFEGEPEQVRMERPLQSRSKTEWYQSEIALAIAAADGGDMTMAGQLWRSMRRDGTFAGLLATRAGGLVRLPKKFRGTPEAMAEMEPSPESGRVSLFDRVFPAKELELFVGDGIGLGVAVGEFLDIPGREEPLFVRLDPEFLRYRWAEDRWYYASVAGLLPITPGDGRWVLHMPGGYQQPWNQGLWPAAGRAYVAKEHAYMYRENYSGKLANPARVAVSPQGATEEQRQSFFRRIMAWGLNTVFGLPPGWDVRLLEINGQGFKVFQDTIESCDREFEISLVGQVVTVDGGAGFSNASIHETVRSDLIQGDGNAIAETLNLQALPHVVARMLGGGHSATVSWDTTPPADLKANAEALAAATDAIEQTKRILEGMGYEVSVSELIARFKIPARRAPAPANDVAGPRALPAPRRAA